MSALASLKEQPRKGYPQKKLAHIHISTLLVLSEQNPWEWSVWDPLQGNHKELNHSNSFPEDQLVLKNIDLSDHTPSTALVERCVCRGGPKKKERSRKRRETTPLTRMPNPETRNGSRTYISLTGPIDEIDPKSIAGNCTTQSPITRKPKGGGPKNQGAAFWSIPPLGGGLWRSCGMVETRTSCGISPCGF